MLLRQQYEKNVQVDPSMVYEQMCLQNCSIDSMSSLIYDMLDLSQIRSGTFKFKNTRFDLRELMKGITKNAELQTK